MTRAIEITTDYEHGISECMDPAYDPAELKGKLGDAGFIPEEEEKEIGKKVLTEVGFYFDQLKRIPKNYLSHDQIKEVYRTIRKYELAIISQFYFMESFRRGLTTIKERLLKPSGEKSKRKRTGNLTKEQSGVISRISRKPLFKNGDKEKEFIRIRPLLEKLNSQENKKCPLVIFQDLYEELPGKKKDYADFIDYLVRTVKAIDTLKWGKKTKKVAQALTMYTGIPYSRLSHSVNYFAGIADLEFENHIYYQDSYNELKEEVGQTGPMDIIHKTLYRTSRYENKITGLYHILSEKFYRYVIYIARKFKSGVLPFSDLIQEGNIGLLKAVKKFNHDLGYQFITYAFWWIRQGITRAIADQSRTIRIPVHIHQEYGNIKKIIQEMQEEKRQMPDLKLLAGRTGKTEDELEQLFETFEFPLSLNQELKEGTGRNLGSIQPDIKAVNPQNLLEQKALREEINYQLNYLTEKEANLLTLRFGLKDGNEYTLEEVAKKFHVTRERVRQIEAKALIRIKRRGEKRLKPYLALCREDRDYYS